MSTPRIEREVEDVEEEDSTEQPQTPPPTSKKNMQHEVLPNNETHEKPVKNVDVDANEHVENAQSKPIYACKTVKKLSKDERSMLEDKFKKGVEDPYFKVIRMSNGAIRITKRRNPIVADVKQAQEERSTRIATAKTSFLPGDKVGRLTNEQLLMEHIIDLETRFESMRLKHKKLKKRYNELENSIYEDVDNDAKPVVDVDVTEQEPTQHVQETHEQPQQASVDEQPAYTQKRRLKKFSWRDSIEYM